MCVFLEALWVCSSFHERQCTMSSHSSCRTARREQTLAARTLPPVTIQELRLALQDEWAAMPQQLIDTLILSMGRRCETCLAEGVGHPSGKVVSDVTAAPLGMGSNPGEDMDVCKCVVPSRQGANLKAVKPQVLLGGW
ncbi:hypothetical protein TNCV_944201 [Trichonephila clavipes]|nr:hypothetical protein TNCV_944201 [Trichonephila clavipes]